MSSIALKQHIRILNLELPEVQKNELTNKALSYFEKLKLKLPARDRYGGNCRSVACIHLASKSLDIPISYKALEALSAISSEKYAIALKEITNILDFKQQVSFEQLAVKFGHPNITKKCENILPFVLESLNKNRKLKTMKLNEAIIKLALFDEVCKKANIKLDNVKLMKQVICIPKEYKFIKEEIDQFLDKQGKGVKRVLENESEQLDGHVETRRTKKFVSPFLGYSMVPCQPFEKSKTYLDYIDWKKSMLAKLEG